MTATAFPRPRPSGRSHLRLIRDPGAAEALALRPFLEQAFTAVTPATGDAATDELVTALGAQLHLRRAAAVRAALALALAAAEHASAAGSVPRAAAASTSAAILDLAGHARDAEAEATRLRAEIGPPTGFDPAAARVAADERVALAAARDWCGAQRTRVLRTLAAANIAGAGALAAAGAAGMALDAPMPTVAAAGLAALLPVAGLVVAFGRVALAAQEVRIRRRNVREAVVSAGERSFAALAAGIREADARAVRVERAADAERRAAAAREAWHATAGPGLSPADAATVAAALDWVVRAEAAHATAAVEAHAARAEMEAAQAAAATHAARRLDAGAHTSVAATAQPPHEPTARLLGAWERLLRQRAAPGCT